ncbi:excise [Arthrobacter phage Constance]|uniref:Excise n=5 Tax=Bridgettevirus TaxID=2733170 RepID=A0A3G2KIA7_9CAUD|nr:excise [Arthrobacter phage Bridgette]YP_009815315.1 excise [Arthrobacter phage Constance]YP_009815453.1 excise [Arthrobacter phage Eileen]YP_009815521.1 excise [Arthrobacter phage Judy]YP_009815589.1 excise [Arthrobacter phage Peas]UVK58435.1 excise [Arthrobacter phage GlobiWarming]AYN57308.1 excise [Arthrobacter phage Bridgette]AYN57448.1 excise [Arthrobacter phage Constance]AYN57827.1 excise [Arthrobacter phage Eileen]AYN58113.1 excise [Arthrobacter phage Judy]
MTTQVFRTPEQVAPELGMTKYELRNYCKISGIHTRLSKNRIMLHQDDIDRLVEWVRERKAAKDDWAKEPEHDPFK